MKKYVDLRSDTVTVPTPGMIEAMATAEVGDDVYGEDPTINKLESRVAELVGMDEALFVPSGTMANQIAMNAHCHPGDAVICEDTSHVYLYEAGGAAALSGVQLTPLKGRLTEEAVARNIYVGNDVHMASSSLLSLENTHNMGGGKALSPKTLSPIVSLAKRSGLRIHCDGARLWNASVALGLEESELVVGMDSVAVCFSKGLGAPVGSILAGDAALIGKSRKIRKRLGGGMRQAGYLAAAALYALDHHRQRLSEDHEKAAAFAGEFQEQVAMEYPEGGTNMVYLTLDGINGEEAVNWLGAKGILVSHLGQNRLRLVWHLGISDADQCVLMDEFKQSLDQRRP